MPPSPNLVDDLRQQVADRQVVIIAGAGVSIASTGNARVASWRGLLQDGYDRCATLVQPPPSAEWKRSVEAELSSGEVDLLLSAAEKISIKLGAPDGGEFGRWLRETVGALRVTDRRLIDAVLGLDAPIVTTNYDPLFEEVSGFDAFTSRDPASVENVIRRAETGIVHLHGFYRQPDTVVLGIRSYEKQLADVYSQALLRGIQALKTVVFVGFGAGLDDPNLGALMKWSADALKHSHYRRFRLARRSEVTSLAAAIDPNTRLFVLDYGNDYDDLAPFLESLRRTSQAKAKPAPTSSELIVLGPGIVFEGERVGARGSAWKIRIDRFRLGGLDQLTTYMEQLPALPRAERFVILEASRDGRVLTSLHWEKRDGLLIADIEIESRRPREDISKMIDMKLDFFDEGADLASGFGTVKGVEAVRNLFHSNFHTQVGGWSMHPDFGVRVADLADVLGRDMEALRRVVTLELIRLSSVPAHDELMNRDYLPLPGVERVHNVVCAPHSKNPKKVSVTADLEMHTIGPQKMEFDAMVYRSGSQVPPLPSEDPSVLGQ